MKIPDLPLKKININPAQLYFIMWLVNSATLVWGRGTGKSFIIAWLIHMIVKHMPRATWGIYGRSFAIMLEITLLPTFFALEQFGYIQDIHYVVRKKPVDKLGFTKALKPPIDFKYTITFFNGTTFQLLSEDRTSRGSDLQGIICDESRNINKLKFDEQIIPAIRGFKDLFQHIPFYRGHFHFSSMPDTTIGKWLLDHADYYLEDKYDIDKLNKKLINFQLAFLDARDDKMRADIIPDINNLKKKIKYYPTTIKRMDGSIKFFYSEANAFDNLKNVGLNYLVDLRRTMMDLPFRIEMLNEKIPSVISGFYVNLNDELHVYDNYDYNYIDTISHDLSKLKEKDCRRDQDLDKVRPLYMGIDFGVHINVACVLQYTPKRIRFLKDFYEKSPGVLKHMIKQFIDYYRFHKKKLLRLSWDIASSSQQQFATHRTLINQVAKMLRDAGWKVELLTKGKKLSHHDRYEMINNIYLMNELDPANRKYPIIEYHRYNCHNLLIALANTEVKQARNSFEKDKKGEKNPARDQLREPHLTDAHDYVLDDLLKNIYRQRSKQNLGTFYTGG